MKAAVLVLALIEQTLESPPPDGDTVEDALR